ncbi:hypothetical protein FPZ12_020980 [Amycolatopsis acidicola]|uniref:Htaa domain-containing protein n=1 Tax=Amycolatopsis acidicola TaxID=2596893 RepID=A0A5N0V2N4_9PSEU|nr:HtaA domain-containing protein [Amycolatopsis acidicola]KAA9159028.1 hypothetical protein FPZ12_020980 [Amycolatopsis acidicola]
MTDPREAQPGTPADFTGLTWGIKSSFVAYVARTPDGKAYLSRGAGVNERNEILFPHKENEATDANGTVFAFGGLVQFDAHFGMMSVRISEPRVTVIDGKGELTVPNPDSAGGEYMRLVTFDLAGPVADDGRERWDATDVRLAPEGVELFGETYQAGEPFETFSFTVA